MFIPDPNCPELFTLLAFLFMQEYREKKMDNKKAKKPTDQNSFHGTNKYTNGSHGYISVFVVLFYFPLQNKYSFKTSKIILEFVTYLQSILAYFFLFVLNKWVHHMGVVLIDFL